MDLLATNMETITDFSGRISDTLQDRRVQITKLSGVHTLLKKVSRKQVFRSSNKFSKLLKAIAKLAIFSRILTVTDNYGRQLADGLIISCITYNTCTFCVQS